MSLPDGAGAVEPWPMINVPKDGTMLRLLVRFADHSLEDTDEPVWTIGSNGLDLGQEDEWVFAGWSWQSDVFTNGVGEVIGWLPFFDSENARLTQEATDAIARAERLAGMDDLIATHLTDAENLASLLKRGQAHSGRAAGAAILNSLRRARQALALLQSEPAEAGG